MNNGEVIIQDQNKEMLIIWPFLYLKYFIKHPLFSPLDDSFDEDDFDEDAYYERLGTRPPLDSLGSAYQRMVELFCLCTEEDPSKRPSAAQIVQALESNSQLDDERSEVIVID